MNIKQLRDAIANMSDDIEISFYMDSGCCGDFEEMTAYDIENYDNQLLTIRFNSLPGYRNCRTAANNKKVT